MNTVQVGQRAWDGGGLGFAAHPVPYGKVPPPRWWGTTDWRTYRDVYQLPSGEYDGDSSWTGTCVVRGSYRHDCLVYLLLRVWGKHDTKGRLRARRWSVCVAFGSPPHNRKFSTFTPCASGSCKSVAQAERNATRAYMRGECDESIASLLAWVYSPRHAQSWFLLEGDEWRPWLTQLGPKLSHLDMPPGRYFATFWVPTRDGWQLSGEHISNEGHGTSISMGPEYVDTMNALGTWVPKPEDS